MRKEGKDGEEEGEQKEIRRGRSRGGGMDGGGREEKQSYKKYVTLQMKRSADDVYDRKLICNK